ncbi:glycosyltransferase [Bacillus sp. FJAT-29790]|uniref:glycosyltransferase n=1 Tax=Bacillus sp. FJAT-29790 TaxID=1895002 RepID=UPI001C22945D|nr:glycosyltransferase [Bacillus sp. FJAT-29790]MBU8880777.1 glycosyltransferase [Bacillus sp. FJAT-29790]
MFNRSLLKKVLYTAAVDSHILHFYLPYLKWFKDQNFEVHVATNGNANIPFADVKHNIPFERSPFKLGNVKVYMVLKQLIKKHNYQIIHWHTPTGGVLTRLAAKKARKRGTKVLYTAHGFHFFKGAPFTNWLLYYPLKKWLATFTDCLITINEEDYARAKKFMLKSTKLVNGVGINLKIFTPQTEELKTELRKTYQYQLDDFILLFVEELNENKHQDLLIEAVSLLQGKIPNLKYYCRRWELY